MRKFEYCELEITIGGPLSGTQGEATLLKTEGNHEVRKGRYGMLLAQLGLEGWELVAGSARIESGLGGKHKVNYILMRSMSDE